MNKFLMLATVVFAFGGAAAIGCTEDGGYVPPPGTPDQTVPGIAEVISGFRGARDSAEEMASSAKGKVRLSKRLAEGQELYRAARVAHNRAIALIDASLGLPLNSVDRDGIKQALADAGRKQMDFQRWYQNIGDRRPTKQAEAASPTSASSLAELIPTVFEVFTTLVQIGDERSKAQREWMREALKECLMPSWDSI